MDELDDSLLSALFLRESKACRFRVWAPLKTDVFLHLPASTEVIAMKKDEHGYFSITVEGISPDCQYMFAPQTGRPLPDPASNYQPQGVHGYSQVVNHHAFRWTDSEWRGVPVGDLVLYELHVGTFTKEGTFEAIIDRLDDLRDCGINAIELMPVSQFPGKRNWGYDAVFPYAVQNSYGGPEGLKKLVDACHLRGIAVFLDVVYNHIGPEGNCLKEYGPYFTKRYGTPWGEAINFDDEWSDAVRDYFANNALYWFEYYHIDGLRLDAIHMVFDNGAVHFWQYLDEKMQILRKESAKPLHLIAESDINSPKVVRPVVEGGFAFTGQWLDDFHHALYVMLDEKGRGRYEDFGRIEQLAKAFKEGFVHSGEYVKFRKRKHGTSSAGVPGDKFVAFTSNHDQIGNRPDGSRLSRLVGFDQQKLAAAALICSPYLPMLFMGDEYGEVSPFYYFIEHSDPDLIEAVRKGRKQEFKAFATKGKWMDPQDEKTFARSVLDWDLRQSGRHAILHAWHKKLISLRNQLPALKNFRKEDVDVIPLEKSALIMYRRDEAGNSVVLCAFNFGSTEIGYLVPGTRDFRKVLDSRDSQWNEEGKTLPVASDSISNGRLCIPGLTVGVYTSV